MNKAHHTQKASIKSLLYLCLISTAFSQAMPASAQITPDNSLGAEASQLNPNVLINGVLGDKINGGAIRKSNLFHSFSEFNIQDGQRVYFANPTGVENILTRVTGGNASNIFGTLGVDGAANLFLINPSGILFGENALLDVQGSFVGTTANGVQFGNQGIFSATNPQAPPLLTVNPSALFFNQINQGAGIQNNSVAPAGIDPAGLNALGLRVGDGKSLLLVGGNVSMDGGRLNAYGGRVELGGLAAPGNVNLLFNEDNFSLKFPLNVTRAEVSLTNQARISVKAAGGGDIAINTRNIEILGKSVLSAGIAEGLGTPETVAGDITLNATGEIKIAGTESGIYNLVRLGSKGNGGNITIDSGSFSLKDGAQLSASTYGQGNAGNVTVRALNNVDLVNADISSTVSAGGIGKGGNIDINAATLSLTDGAQLGTATREVSDTQPAGRGDAGNVNVNVTDTVNISGEKNGSYSGIFSYVDTGTVGNGGNITIDSGSFSLKDGALLSASTYGQGNAGNVTVRALDAVDLVNADIFSTVSAGGIGKGGNIDINAATLSLVDGAQLLTITREASDTQPAGRGDAGNVNVNVTDTVNISGEKNGFISGIGSFVGTGTVGNGGNITIDSGSFSLKDGALLSASTYGQGNAGNVTVRALDAVDLAGKASISSTVSAGGVGKGGNININAATLSLIDGAQLQTATREASDTQPAGRGDAGNVNVNVTDTVNISGEKNGSYSGIFSYVDTGTVGNGGNITIDSGSFSLKDGALLSASTYGQGNAGNVTVRALDGVDLAGNAYIFSTVQAGGVGKGGNIDINAATLSLIDGALLLTFTDEASDTQSAGRGDAGNVNVNVTDTVNISGEKNGFISGIGSFVGTGTVGNGGNITIDSGSFSLSDRAQLSTSTYGQGNAGNVTVSAKDAVSLANAGILSAVGARGVGKGGNIDINAATLSLTDGAFLAASTLGVGNAGNVTVNTKDAVSLADAYILSTVQAGGVGKGGNIYINAATLSLIDGASLSSFTSSTFNSRPAGRGDAGNVNVKVTGAVDIAGSVIFSSVETGGVGNGGNITIDSSSFSLRDGAVLVASTYGQGNAGNVNVKVTGAVDIAGSVIFSSVDTGGVGNGGNITIDSGNFSLRDGAVLAASTLGQGNAGNVRVSAKNAVYLANAGIFTTVEAGTVSNGGNIEINSPKITLDNQSGLSAESASGNAGNINVNSDLLLLRRGAQISTSAGTAQSGGDGGNININSKFIVAIPNENSNISANAFSGTGGNIQINSQGIFGIESRPKPTEKSDITASSELGISGVTNINTPDNSSIQNSLTELPQNAIDTNALIANSCISRGTKRQENSFTITGSGAITPNRPGVLVSNYTTGEVRGVEITSHRPWKKGDPIIEPQGLYRLPNGQLILSRSCS
ncbi:filamentous hemagglutinin N-terminal domain-containing protein [Nostoc sp. ChiQUE01b]|uniref:beta strand repeat-containing protein n=1 Tax=Nostoc sp. ChiQUE01b TaxID=3075376 RepID=UPI002AD345DA|nr:filamentous hemagglutinin N-terminal domain-containing protein [Nostoc sp. ChiQUE01b]MDZ8263259.1 filamentous hemagglutinin N-terminal domain-containing protein [Nostoc sp. ChiQUE01b]